MSIELVALDTFGREGFTGEVTFHQDYDIDMDVDKLVLIHKVKSLKMYEGWGWTATALYPFDKDNWDETSSYYSAITIDSKSVVTTELAEAYGATLSRGVINRLHVGDYPVGVGLWGRIKRRLFTPMRLVPPTAGSPAVIVWKYIGRQDV